LGRNGQQDGVVVSRGKVRPGRHLDPGIKCYSGQPWAHALPGKFGCAFWCACRERHDASGAGNDIGERAAPGAGTDDGYALESPGASLVS
jgi:hypothetical protein